jgi:hypothetical protein
VSADDATVEQRLNDVYTQLRRTLTPAEKGLKTLENSIAARLCDDCHGENTGCLVAQDLALLTKVRTLIHEEISLLAVLYFQFRCGDPY